jgi:hypothetical protein
MVTSLIDFALLGGTGNRLKSRTTAKLKEKQTSIAIAWSETHYQRLPSSRAPFFLITDYLQACFSPQVSSNKLMDNLLSLVDFPKLDRYVFIYFRNSLSFTGVVPLFQRILLNFLSI